MLESGNATEWLNQSAKPSQLSPTMQLLEACKCTAKEFHCVPEVVCGNTHKYVIVTPKLIRYTQELMKFTMTLINECGFKSHGQDMVKFPKQKVLTNFGLMEIFRQSSCYYCLTLYHNINF